MDIPKGATYYIDAVGNYFADPNDPTIKPPLKMTTNDDERILYWFNLDGNGKATFNKDDGTCKEPKGDSSKKTKRTDERRRKVAEEVAATVAKKKEERKNAEKPICKKNPKKIFCKFCKTPGITDDCCKWCSEDTKNIDPDWDINVNKLTKVGKRKKNKKKREKNKKRGKSKKKRRRKGGNKTLKKKIIV